MSCAKTRSVVILWEYLLIQKLIEIDLCCITFGLLEFHLHLQISSLHAKTFAHLSYMLSYIFCLSKFHSLYWVNVDNFHQFDASTLFMHIFTHPVAFGKLKTRSDKYLATTFFLNIYIYAVTTLRIWLYPFDHASYDQWLRLQPSYPSHPLVN